uniref:uncharacterized protein n=1 Tax=Myxine glutinosa TaxID=7769 RepID=UPI00358EC277
MVLGLMIHLHHALGASGVFQHLWDFTVHLGHPYSSGRVSRANPAWNHLGRDTGHRCPGVREHLGIRSLCWTHHHCYYPACHQVRKKNDENKGSCPSEKGLYTTRTWPLLPYPRLHPSLLLPELGLHVCTQCIPLQPGCSMHPLVAREEQVSDCESPTRTTNLLHTLLLPIALLKPCKSAIIIRTFNVNLLRCIIIYLRYSN